MLDFFYNILPFLIWSIYFFFVIKLISWVIELKNDIENGDGDK